MLTRGEPGDATARGKELERESVSEDPGATLYWNPLLVADENGQITIDVTRGRAQNLRIVIDAHAAGRLGSLATTIRVRDLPVPPNGFWGAGK